MGLSPIKPSKYRLHRDDVSTTDTIANVLREHGIHMGDYEKALIQVVPKNTANPTVSVYWWSDGAEGYIQSHSKITKAGIGAGTAFEFEVDAFGRMMFVSVDSLAAGSVDIYVAGYNRTPVN